MFKLLILYNLYKGSDIDRVQTSKMIFVRENAFVKPYSARGR